MQQISPQKTKKGERWKIRSTINLKINIEKNSGELRANPDLQSPEPKEVHARSRLT